MAYRLIWAPLARQDLRDLLAYLAEDDPSAARRFIRGIFQTAKRLAEFLQSGRQVPEFDDPSIREVIRRPCRIVYRLKDEDALIDIARVWHARRGTPDT